MRRVRIDIMIACAILIVCLTVYVATLTPGLSYASPDGNELATVAYTLGLAHSTGYPLYTWLGKLFTLLPIGGVAYRVNLMSAVLGAAGVALLYGLLRRLTAGDPGRPVWPSRVASAFGALLFGLSRTFWSQTTIAEVYAANIFMVTLTLTLLMEWARVAEEDRAQLQSDRRGWRRLVPSPRSLLLLLATGLCLGLSLGTHMSNLGLVPAFALFVLLIDPWTAASPLAVGSAGAGFLVGTLQFLWLPLRANALFDGPMRARAPTTLRGIYRYTLGAFPEFKFAFPVTALPVRIVLYIHFLFQQFGLVGVLLGIAGMWALLLRRPRTFFLIVTIYLMQVWFFIQYRAMDLEVFFLIAHLTYALFIGCGVAWLLERLAGLRPRALRGALAGLVVLGMLAGLGWEVRTNWEVNDRSADTAIDDFYTNLFPLLPEGAVLLGRSGVFGYDMFYYRLVYGVRPDVLIPALELASHPRSAQHSPIYSTLQPNQPGVTRGPWAIPEGWVPRDTWAVPVLLGASGLDSRGRSLTLYHLSSRPPELVVTDAQPQHPSGESLGPLTLVGYDLETEEVEAGGMLELTLYWRITGPIDGLRVGTALGGEVVEAHELGLGNLRRYVETYHPSQDGIVVEQLRIVVPGTTQPGPLELEVVGVQPFRGEGPQVEERVVLQEVTVTDGREER